MIQSLNPATGKLLRTFDALTPDAINTKLAIAAHAAKTYPSESLDQRIFWMRRLAALLEADTEDLAAIMTAEMGKTLASARQEVAKCAAACRYYAENAARILTPEHIATGNAQSYVRYDPLGVVLAVMPWNFPLWQVFRFAAPALIAGNVALLKHASNVPQCALEIEALIRRAGFPRGTFQTLLVEARQVEGLLSDNRVAAVTVTGSEAAGRAIAAQAGWLIKKTVLELGGSDPFIVLPSADLDEAVPNAIMARCVNNGQSCIAAKRFLVHEDVYDEFEKRFVAGMAALRVGDPTAESTELGPLATPQIVDDLLAQVSRARAAGGRVLTGGDRISTIEGGSRGNYFQPTVIAGVLRTASICQEEIFGPVALLFRIGSVEEAIALANDTPFGLSASVWTTDTAEQNRLAAQLQCGGVFFNATVASDPRLPFGGIKRSGYGRELSTAGMREFLNAKTIVIGGPAITAQPSLFDQPKAEVHSGKPSEFLQIADQLRRFEPRRPDSRQPETREPGLPTRRDTFEPRKDKPESRKEASELRKEKLEPRKDTPEPRKDNPEPRKDISEPPKEASDPLKIAPESPKDELPAPADALPPNRANQLPPIIFGPKSDDDDDPPPSRGSILGLR